jgi:major vault protein
MRFYYFCCSKSIKRIAGDRWMIHGPLDYIPHVEVIVLASRKAIPLDKNEGIYVRNVKSGVVKTVIGETYMLNENEELWEKHLPSKTEQLISSTKDRPSVIRDKTRVVEYYLAHNRIIKVFDNKTKVSRFVFFFI